MKYPVLLPNIFDYPFTYESNIKLKAGDYVKVPFGKKNIIGVIWDFFEEKNNKEFKLKSIIEKRSERKCCTFFILNRHKLIGHRTSYVNFS